MIENEFIDACLCVRVWYVCLCVCVCVVCERVCVRARACVEREMAMPRMLQLLLFATTVCTLLLPQPLLAIRCYTTSFDVRNWKACSEHEYGRSSWDNRCVRL